MSLKYRVRLQNDRVIGPFEEKELVELATNEHLEGSEKYQMFPIGDWLPITSFPNLSKILEPHFEAIAEKKRIELEKENIAEKARERLLKTRDEKTSSAIKDFKEFKYEQGAKVDVDYRELEKKHRAVTGENEDQVDKTIVRRFKKNKTPVEIDKTIVLKKNEKNPESVEEKEETDIKDLEKYKIIISPEEMANEQTQFIDLVEILPTINAQLRISEIQLEQMAKIQESEERHREKIVKDKEVKEEQKRVLEKAAIK